MFEVGEVRSGVDTEVFEKHITSLLVGRQGICLSSGPIKRRHEQRVEALTIRMTSRERSEECNGTLVVPESEECLDLYLFEGELPFGKLGTKGLGEVVVLEFGERITRPQGECIGRDRRGLPRLAGEDSSGMIRQRDEPVRVDRVRIDFELVAIRGRSHDPGPLRRGDVGLQGTTESGDVESQCTSWIPRLSRSVEDLSRAIERDRSVQVRQEEGKQFPLHRGGHWHPSSRAKDAEVPEDLDLKRLFHCAHRCVPASRPLHGGSLTQR